jgi:hypothetical protein
MSDREEILSIASDLREGYMSTDEAKRQLLKLLNPSASDFDKLGTEEGSGSYCCGKRMVLAPSEIVYHCLNCGHWEYSSS